MTDSHCHLELCTDLAQAADPSLRAIVSVGITPESAANTVSIAENYANVWAAVGVHPNHSDEATPEARQAIEALATHPRVVAIGETGFDRYWDDSSPEQQREVFFWHGELARRLSKPLILHVRDKQNSEEAARQAVSCLRELNWPKGILHCFNGHPDLLETGLELGWMVSFAGNLTYKNAQTLHLAARRIPRDRLLVETDSPYLSPQAKRGQRNVPANVRFTAAFLAELRGETQADVESYTDENARNVYELPL